MKRLLVLIGIIGVLAFPGAATAGAGFGVADDAGKYADDGGTRFFAQLRALGMTDNRVTVLWHADRPRTIVEKPFLDRALPNATRHGIRVVFHVYPATPTDVAGSPERAAAFADFVGLLARTYPQVSQFVVGNEPNQPRFWRPQFRGRSRPVAARDYAALLARAYDALKDVSAGNTVIGVALSSRGNDSPGASSNVSRSPVRFLRDLGLAYRASGRDAPLMDELAFHPYPRSDRDPVTRGHRWPRAGVPDLARIKQAFWDAFHGTAQPTFEDGLKLRIDEIGWQVGIPGRVRRAYHGRESVAVTTEAAQARNYARLVAVAACDASISAVYFLGLRDERDLERFQSGLVRADGSRRASYAAVRAAIARARNGCAGRPAAWQHATSVLGARARFGALAKPAPRARRWWSFTLTAAEEATYRAGVFRLAGAEPDARQLSGALRAGGARPKLMASGRVRAGWHPLVRFPARPLPPGRYVYAVRLVASTNPARTTFFVSRAFTVR